MFYATFLLSPNDSSPSPWGAADKGGKSTPTSSSSRLSALTRLAAMRRGSPSPSAVGRYGSSSGDGGCGFGSDCGTPAESGGAPSAAQGCNQRGGHQQGACSSSGKQGGSSAAERRGLPEAESAGKRGKGPAASSDDAANGGGTGDDAIGAHWPSPDGPAPGFEPSGSTSGGAEAREAEGARCEARRLRQEVAALRRQQQQAEDEEFKLREAVADQHAAMGCALSSAPCVFRS